MNPTTNGSPAAETLYGLVSPDQTPFGKVHYNDADGALQHRSYRAGKLVSSVALDYGDTATQSNAVKAIANVGGCLINGQLDRPLVNESRAGHVPSNCPTRTVVADIDGLQTGGVEDVQKALELDWHSHTLQYSASSGIKPGVCAHLIYMASRRVRPRDLRNWLLAANFNSPVLREAVGLARNKVALTYALDITSCDSGRLIYIADPTFPSEYSDPFHGRLVWRICG